MELIDRKPFVEYANEQITGIFAYPQGRKAEDEKAYREKWEFVRNVLMSAPIVEAEPVRHGKWIWTGSCQVCSICDEEQYGVDTGRYYCPNCGAKMDGKE